MSNEPEKPNPAPEQNPPSAPETPLAPDPVPAPENPPASAPAPASENPPPAPAPAATGGGGTADKKLISGLLGILLGSLGIHKFYLGYQKEGIIMLVVTIVLGGVTCGAGVGVMGIVGLIEGILYLTKTDEEFTKTYVTGQKPWF